MKQAPEIKIPFFEYYRLATTDPIGLRTRIFFEYGEIASRKLKGITTYHLSHPDYLKRVFKDNQENYFPRHYILRMLFEPVFGKHSLLLTDNLEEWIRDRNIANISFDPKVYFDEYSKTITNLTKIMLERWAIEYQDGQYIDVVQEVGTLVLLIVIKTIFNEEADVKFLFDAVTNLPEFFKKRTRTLPFLWYFSSERRLCELLLKKVKAEAFDKIIRRFQMTSVDDMLGQFLQEYKDLPREELITLMSEHVITFTVVGYFTTMSLILWVLVELSYHPEVERKVTAEVNKVIGNRLPTFDDLNQLKYLSMVIKETLRLHPPLFTLLRGAIDSDTLGEFAIPKGSGVSLNIYQVHRHPDFWNNPEGFDPERFLNNPLGQSHPFAYLPFGSGQRRCPGSGFSTMEAMLMISMIVQRAQLCLPAYSVVAPFLTTPMITMRPNIKQMRLHFKG